jgi:hypothetical protein
MIQAEEQKAPEVDLKNVGLKAGDLTAELNKGKGTQLA